MDLLLSFSIIVILIPFIVVLLANLANYMQRKGSYEPIEKIKQKLLCKDFHSWKEVYLLNHNQQEAYLKDPENYLKGMHKTTYCDKCGYVPGVQGMIKAPWMKKIKDAQTKQEETVQRTKDITELKELWFKEFVAINKIGEGVYADMARAGFDAYDSFVSNLPELVKSKELSRLLEKLKMTEKT